MRSVTRVVIIGGGPGGYEAALVASQLGGEVTLVDSDGLGGSAVLTDCVPSKTLIATAEVMTEVRRSRPSWAAVRRQGRAGRRDRASTWTSARSTGGCSSWPSGSPTDIGRRLREQGVEVVSAGAGSTARTG